MSREAVEAVELKVVVVMVVVDGCGGGVLHSAPKWEWAG